MEARCAFYSLQREMAREFDVFLFAFTEDQSDDDLARDLEFCRCPGRAACPGARYREPRWSTLAPPEACEFRSPAMRELVERYRREWSLDLIQVEYTYMATYWRDVLVEHDVHLRPVCPGPPRRPSLGAWWN